MSLVQKIHGFAGRCIEARESKLDNGLIVVEIQNAIGGHCASVVLTAKGAKQLADAMEAEAQRAMAINLRAELAVSA